MIGAIARKGNIVCQMVEDADFRTYDDFVRKTISSKVDLIATDESSGIGISRAWVFRTILSITRAKNMCVGVCIRKHRIVLVVVAARHHGLISQGFKRLSSALFVGVHVPPQQAAR